MKYIMMTSLALVFYGVSSQDLKKFDEKFKAVVDTKKGIQYTKGASMRIFKPSKVIRKWDYGYANVSKKITGATIYNWASISKTLTAICVMQLRDRKLLKLDDKVFKYLPSFSQVSTAVTIRQLLNHSSGVRIRPDIWNNVMHFNENGDVMFPVSREQFMLFFPHMFVGDKPGKKFEYSNLGYSLLGYLVEAITQDSFENYAMKNVLLPLGMYNSYFGQSPTYLQKKVSQSYIYFAKDSLVRVSPDVQLGAEVANGGLNASMDDMMKYSNFVANGDEKVLSRETLGEMFKPEIFVNEDSKDGWRKFVGLGFFIYKFTKTGEINVYHAGGQFGFQSDMYIDPKRKISAISIFNCRDNELMILRAGRAFYRLRFALRNFFKENQN